MPRTITITDSTATPARRKKSITVSDDYREATPALLSGSEFDVGKHSSPAFGDVDGDGDLDLVVGNKEGLLRYFENETPAATPSAPRPVLTFVERTGSSGADANPFAGFDAGRYDAPALGDVDGDGDLDLVVGEYDGILNYYENTGSRTSPTFVARTGSANPFGEFVYGAYRAFDVGHFVKPVLGDVDGDGDLDLVVGESTRALKYYENTTPGGPNSALRFEERTGNSGDNLNPFRGVHVSFNAPALADVDGDGDLDLMVGEYGALSYYRNTGLSGSPTFVRGVGSENPFSGVDSLFHLTPTSGDVNGDGVPDLVVGEWTGTLSHFTRPLREAVVYTFDVDGKRTGSREDTDGNGSFDRTITFMLDGNGAKTGSVRVDTVSLSGGGTRTETRTYDATDKLTARTDTYDADGNGTTERKVTWTVDATGRETGYADDADADGTVDEITSFTFDDTGKQTGYKTVGFNYATSGANVFSAIDTRYDSVPALADLDGDGDLDLVVGDRAAP